MAAGTGDKSLEEAIALSLQKNTKLASEQPQGMQTAGVGSEEVSLQCILRHICHGSTCKDAYSQTAKCPPVHILGSCQWRKVSKASLTKHSCSRLVAFQSGGLDADVCNHAEALKWGSAPSALTTLEQ